jgi:hypothetical protein
MRSEPSSPRSVITFDPDAMRSRLDEHLRLDERYGSSSVRAA